VALTDFFVASPKELREADAAELPAPFETFQMKNVDIVELGTLNGLLTESDAMPDLVTEVTKEGPWVYRLPVALVKALASLEDKALSRVAAQWAKTEEFTRDGATASQAKAILTGLRELAKKAGARKAVFVWTSL
jgi:hypothetical protein